METKSGQFGTVLCPAHRNHLIELQPDPLNPKILIAVCNGRRVVSTPARLHKQVEKAAVKKRTYRRKKE